MRTTFAAIRGYNFRLWALGNFVSVTGTWMQVLGVNWLVLSLTRSPVKMGAAVLVQSLPALLLGPFGGALADRLPARPLLVVTQTLHAVLAALLALITWVRFDGINAIFAIVLLTGVLSAVDGPAMGRFGSAVVAPEHLGNALAFGSMVNSAGRILGMGVGGIIVASMGAAPLFALNAVSFLAVVLTLFLLRTRALVRLSAPSVHENVVFAVRTSIRYLARDRWLTTTFALAFVLGSLGRNYQVTMAAMTAGPLHAGAAGYAALSTAFAVGGVVGALLAARRRRLSYRFLALVGFTASVLQIVSGVMPSLWSFGLTVGLIAVTAVVIDTVVATRAQLDTPGEMRGRVLALLAVIGSFAGAAGAPLLGWLSEAFGPRECLVIAGFVCAVTSLMASARLISIGWTRPAGLVPEPTVVADHYEPAADAVLAADPVGGAVARPVGELAAAESTRDTGELIRIR